MTAPGVVKFSTGRIWRACAKEPLFHFLIAGLALFLFTLWRGEETDISERTIIVDEDRVSQLASQWEMAWRRPPAAEELDGLIRDNIKEEIYYREAVRLGLDRDDPIIRRRLRSKMEYLATSQVEFAEPDEAELNRFFQKNRARYSANPAHSFRQLYFGDDMLAARNAITTLNSGEKVAALEISLPPYMENADKDAISRNFGDGFASAIVKLPVGTYSGPVKSGFGWHIVRVEERSAVDPPKLKDIRQQVIGDWQSETRAIREEKAYQSLLAGYRIKIASP